MAALPTMLRANRERAGLSEHRAASMLGVNVHRYRSIESGAEPPNWEIWDAICKTFGWGQTFIGRDGG